MNRYTETAYFMQKDSGKFGTLNYSPYLCRQKETAQAFEKKLYSCNTFLAASMLKKPLKATFSPIHLALSGIFCIFAAKTSRLFNPFTI